MSEGVNIFDEAKLVAKEVVVNPTGEVDIAAIQAETEKELEIINPMDLVRGSEGKTATDMVNNLNKSYRAQIANISLKIGEIEKELETAIENKNAVEQEITILKGFEPVDQPAIDGATERLNKLEAEIKTLKSTVDHFCQFKENLNSIAVRREDIEKIVEVLPAIIDYFASGVEIKSRHMRYLASCFNIDNPTAEKLKGMRETIIFQLERNVDSIHNKMRKVFKMEGMSYGKTIASIPKAISQMMLVDLPEERFGKYADIIELTYAIALYALLIEDTSPFEGDNDRVRHGSKFAPYNTALMKIIEVLSIPSMEEFRVAMILSLSTKIDELKGKVWLFGAAFECINEKDEYLKTEKPEVYAAKMEVVKSYAENIDSIMEKLDSNEIVGLDDSTTADDLEEVPEKNVSEDEHDVDAMMEAVKEHEEELEYIDGDTPVTEPGSEEPIEDPIFKTIPSDI